MIAANDPPSGEEPEDHGSSTAGWDRRQPEGAAAISDEGYRSVWRVLSGEVS